MTSTRFVSVLTLMVSFALVSPSHGAGASGSTDVGRLQAEVRELRGLVMQMMRVEHEHYELLMRLIEQRRDDPGGAAPAAPSTASPPSAGKNDAAAPGTQVPPGRTGSVRGTIKLPPGASQDTYAFIENVRAAPVRGRTAEIAQRGKKFVPEVLVVQRGTKVVFPNYDNVAHNVFAPNQPHPFDLGSYRAGETPKGVEMTSPGVVDVFCNMHADMRASVLVVPSPIFARVGADGSFRLDGVPVGSRTLVVWSPRTKAVKQTVQVGASGADVSLALELQNLAVHNKKDGTPYVSYESGK